MAVIYHIANRQTWNASAPAGVYRGDTLERDGFIHCSMHAQVIDTAERYYSGREGLVLLAIDAARLAPELRYEVSTGGALFPHIYGPLNREAVIRVDDFEPGADGKFCLPEEVGKD
jgi:uncharacterized protein (DUF952 family)